ncbi:polygalacturonase inhibitor-like [Iris pallida]|uniref:Polygalacturonase inhibitor-like n=1 Tax=Iris pallida TaxID=29817 RepID=A0AAX6GLE4_IRIPA|nr:polygalacturonase inhibitor-like [Iris pallida]
MALATIVLLLLAIFFFSSSSAQCHDRDKKALLAFKDSFLSTSLDDTWLESTDCCSWDGHVLCDKDTGRVYYLQFSNDKFSPGVRVSLNGSIPAAVGDLSALEVLMFSDLPALVGPIPPQLTKLKKLLTLSIIRTGVSGPVPPFLSKLSSLRQLDLGGNALSGTIPPSLGSLTRLTYIGLYDNQLTGTIPASLYSKLNKKYVAYLQLFGNRLTGRIPSSFGSVDFSQIDLFDNQLTGDASFLLGKSKTNLEIVNLTRNGLEFDFSKVEFPESIKRLDISRNKIYGSIPDQITQLRNLFWFDVSYNRLCGKIPSGGSFPLFDKKYYAHNKCLCGAPLQPCKK